jgi:hypothetical protein
MKKFFIFQLLCLGILSSVSYATGGTDVGNGSVDKKPGSVKLFLIKTVFSSEDSDLEQLISEVQGYQEDYKSSGLFDFSRKNTAQASSCAVIQGHNFSRAVFFQVLQSPNIEEPGAKNVSVEDALANTLIADLNDFFKYLKNAQDNCGRSFKETIKNLTLAKEKATRIEKSLQDIDNGTLDLH